VCASGFEERSRRIKIYRRKQSLHAHKAQEEAQKRAKTQRQRELTGARDRQAEKWGWGAAMKQVDAM
jgi:hypothetical protein